MPDANFTRHDFLKTNTMTGLSAGIGPGWIGTNEKTNVLSGSEFPQPEVSKFSYFPKSYAFAQEYPGEFTFGANEVPDLPDAVKEIEKYLKLGARVIGELKFGVDCDSKEMQHIYKLAEAYQVPVLMHRQFQMFNHNFERFPKMFEKYPKVNSIGHAQTF
jgi:predicted TIM-barrel fold metal-dependent hydrolase